MSEPLSTITAFIWAKFSGIVFSLGGALLTLSFSEDKHRSYWVGLYNIIGSWFLGFVIGDAINEYWTLSGGIASFVYVVSATVGLIIVGGVYRFANDFKNDPGGFIQKWIRKK